jgi:hypothetical protein
VTVDRTSWLDLSLGRFFKRTIALPTDISHEYRQHLCSLVRILKEDKQGNPTAKYMNTAPDHFGHARNYCEIAHACFEGNSRSRTITGNI